MKKIVKCEICGNKNLDKVLNLGLHPLCDDLVTINENRKCFSNKIVYYNSYELLCDLF